MGCFSLSPYTNTHYVCNNKRGEPPDNRKEESHERWLCFYRGPVSHPDYLVVGGSGEVITVIEVKDANGRVIGVDSVWEPDPDKEEEEDEQD